MAEETVATPESIKQDAAAAGKKAQSDFNDQVASLTEKLRVAGGNITKLDEQTQDRLNAPTPTTTTAPGPNLFDPSQLQEFAEKEGVGKAVIQTVAGAAQAIVKQNAADQASLRRELIEKDSELGSLFRRYRDNGQLDKFVKRQKLDDTYFAREGYADVVGMLAFKDKDLRKEEREAVAKDAVDKFKAEQEQVNKDKHQLAQSTTAKTTPSETVQAGKVGAPPTPAPDREEEIAKIEVTDDEVEIGRDFYGLNKHDIQEQRLEIKEQFAKHGPRGIGALGGIPICELSDLKDRQGNPVKPIERK
jgi:hypothetical protein